MESRCRRNVSPANSDSVSIFRMRCFERRFGLAKCMGHFSRDGANGDVAFHGSSPHQSSGRVCSTVLVGSRVWYIPISERYNRSHGATHDLLDALVVWNGGLDRLVEDLRLEKCWIAD